MFSRAAKSVVKSLSQRKCYAGEDNLKITLIGTTEGVYNLNASQLSRHQHSTFNTVPIYDLAGTNKRFLFTQNKSHQFNETVPFCHENSRMLKFMGKSRSYESTSKEDSTMKENKLSYLTDHHKLDVNEMNTEKLVEALHRLPIGEEVGTINHQPFASKAGDTCTGKLRSMMTRILDEMVHDNRYRQVWQKNHTFNENIIDWLLLRPINTIGNISNILTNLNSNGRERKCLKNKTICCKRTRQDKSQKLMTVAPFVKVTLKKSEHGYPSLPPTQQLTNERKIKKRGKKNNDNESIKFQRHLNGIHLKNKSKDWTVPSAFNNKKPRLLYDFNKPNDKIKLSSCFNSKIFEDKYIRNDDYLDLKRFIATKGKIKSRFYGTIKDDKKSYLDSELIKMKDKRRIVDLKSSKSLSQIIPLNDVKSLPIEEDLLDFSGEFIHGFYGSKTNCEIQEEITEHKPMKISIVNKKLDTVQDESKESLTICRIDDKENDFYEKWRPVEKVSSNVKFILENTRRKKVIEKSYSNSSIDSYHLDDFFKIRTLSSGTIKNLFSDPSKDDLDDWLERNFYSCDQELEEPCTCLKEREGFLFYKNRDPCKKDPCAKPDPCKKDPCAKPDPCKKDPCAKPDPCKKDPCAKPDPCKKDPCKKDPCAKPDPCKKDPCKKDPCAKPDPCKKDPCKKDPCAKPDPCKKDPCKKDPCAKPDPCKKDPCKKDPCAKPDPCKKDPCSKPDPCKKKGPCSTSDFRPKLKNPCKTEKADKPPECPNNKKTDTRKEKECPPVIRAPGCPDDSKKDGNICRIPSIYYFKDEFLYKKLFKTKYLKFILPNRNLPINEIDVTNKSNVNIIKTNMELPKFYTLDTFGINYNIED